MINDNDTTTTILLLLFHLMSTFPGELGQPVPLGKVLKGTQLTDRSLIPSSFLYSHPDS